MRSTSFTFVAVIVGILGGPACNREAVQESGPCSLSDAASCPRYMKCRLSVPSSQPHCVELDCYGAADCPANQHCVDGACTSLDQMAGEGIFCQQDADCPPHLACEAQLYGKVCSRPPCYLDTDCGPGEICRNQACTPPPC